MADVDERTEVRKVIRFTAPITVAPSVTLDLKQSTPEVRTLKVEISLKIASYLTSCPLSKTQLDHLLDVLTSARNALAHHNQEGIYPAADH